MAKPDQLIKRRGKLGLIKVKADFADAKAWIQERIGKDQVVRPQTFSLHFSICELGFGMNGNPKGKLAQLCFPFLSSIFPSPLIPVVLSITRLLAHVPLQKAHSVAICIKRLTILSSVPWHSSLLANLVVSLETKKKRLHRDEKVEILNANEDRIQVSEQDLEWQIALPTLEWKRIWPFIRLKNYHNLAPRTLCKDTQSKIYVEKAFFCAGWRSKIHRLSSALLMAPLTASTDGRNSVCWVVQESGGWASALGVIGLGGG